MRYTVPIALALATSTLFAADLPRKSPEFGIQLPDGSQALVSSYKGKVLCLAFILTS